MLDLDDVFQVFRKGSVKSCLKLFIIPGVWRGVLSYRHRRKLKHTDTFMNCKGLCLQMLGADFRSVHWFTFFLEKNTG